MGETSKIRDRVIGYCRGDGIDLGCGTDKITADALGIDRRQLEGVDVCVDASGNLDWCIDERFDYVYSSHFLEHLEFPVECLIGWKRILKKGGYLILYLPHRDHYTEDNPEHKQELTQELVLGWLEAVGGFDIVRNEMDVGPDRYSFLIVAKRNE